MRSWRRHRPFREKLLRTWWRLGAELVYLQLLVGDGTVVAVLGGLQVQRGLSSRQPGADLREQLDCIVWNWIVVLENSIRTDLMQQRKHYRVEHVADNFAAVRSKAVCNERLQTA